MRTHKYLIEPISDTPHLKTMLMSRFKKFHESLIQSTKFQVRFLARLNECDKRTVLGQNLCRLAEECEVNQCDLTIHKIKLNPYITPKDENRWREDIARELSQVQQEHISVDGFSNSEIKEILDYLCIS